jgi:hypothetical protein
VSALDELEAAAHRKLRAQRELRDAQEELDEAIIAIYWTGICKAHVGKTARSDLGLHGFDADAIRLLGLSDASVRKILDRR